MNMEEKIETYLAIDRKEVKSKDDVYKLSQMTQEFIGESQEFIPFAQQARSGAPKPKSRAIKKLQTVVTNVAKVMDLIYQMGGSTSLTKPEIAVKGVKLTAQLEGKQFFLRIKSAPKHIKQSLVLVTGQQVDDHVDGELQRIGAEQEKTKCPTFREKLGEFAQQTLKQKIAWQDLVQLALANDPGAIPVLIMISKKMSQEDLSPLTQQ